MWNTLLLVFLAFYLIYRYFTNCFSHWSDRNVPFLKPVPIFGNFYDALTFRRGIGFLFADIYNKMDHDFLGIWVFRKPHLVVKSPDLVKSILQSDFDYFSNRTVHSGQGVEFVEHMLFFLRNPQWRATRRQLSSAFTGAKLKGMMPLINVCAGQMVSFLQDEIEISDNIEAKELMIRFNIAALTSCIFGIEENPFEKESKFAKVTLKMFKADLENGLRGIAYFFIHSWVDIFRISLFKKDVIEFLGKSFTETLKSREKANVKRNDFVDMLLQCKQKDTELGAKCDDYSKAVAQAIQLYAAGFETSSSTIAFTLYELCINKKYQDKLREDIVTNIKKHGGISSDAIKDMTYLDMCIDETLRKYPVLPFLDRKCERDYQIPGSEIVIEKGTPVFIPLFGLHYDAKYFPDPEKYDPERFSKENTESRHSFCYLPFGQGPHKCIGAQFGKQSSKLALINILINFEVHRNDSTPVPIVFDPKSFILVSDVGLPMKFRKITSDLS